MFKIIPWTATIRTVFEERPHALESSTLQSGRFFPAGPPAISDLPVDFTGNSICPVPCAIKVKRIWDYFSDAGKDVILIGVPQTYPIRPIKGCVVGDFLAGDTSVDYCYPAGLKEEVERVADGYVLDVTGFRYLPKEELLRRIIDMTEKRFRVARHLLATKPWDFFMMVEIGLDRLHHAFWSHVDSEHPKHDPNHPLNVERLVQRPASRLTHWLHHSSR